ncbi:endopeptidase La [Mycoplasma struthionis]|uniref:Lon protease n=1 Tax=Mycoplasma struthionis TaxID=538220 RepID=A0A3G8LG16_9MOLU|nr:endopeptidase La [Mycoplasma struthionis]AZG68576.1 endopeptidase La [Mycoplasma struthionis]
MNLPILPIKKQIVLPFSSTNTTKVGKVTSVAAVNESIKKFGSMIIIGFISKQAENDELISDKKQLLSKGVLARIVSFEEDNGIYKITFDTDDRCDIKEIEMANSKDFGDYLSVAVKGEEYENLGSEEYEKVFNYLVEKSSSYLEKSNGSELKNFKNDKYVEIAKYLENNLNEKFDALTISKISWHICEIIKQDFTIDELRNIVEFSNSEERVLNIIKKINVKIAFKEVENQINENMQNEMGAEQKNFVLREKMRQIQKLLKDGDNKIDEIEESTDLQQQYPDYVLETLKTERAKLSSMMPSSPDANVSRNYIDLIVKLPWRKVDRELIDINHVREVLDKHHSGLTKVKQRILEFISVLTHIKASNKNDDYLPINGTKDQFIDTKLFITKAGLSTNEPTNNIPILTLIGPPGTGKTSLAKSIAEALGRKFVKISLGGVKDESEIRGHRKTYVGAMPGKIINAIKKAGVSNPVILLDEIDKMSADYKGDPTSAMLEVLDPEQNTNFQDHYLELEYDLSKVLFIATANYYESIPPALIDRVELLELSTYTLQEKLSIAKTHLMPKVLMQNALQESQMKISDDILEYIIKSYTREAGVRELKRILDSIARKIVVKILDKEIENDFEVTKEIVTDFLGPVKFEDDENEHKSQIGVVNGLAYTSYGGSTLAIEVTTFEGKEGLKLTGQLKDVMKESAQIALAYVRSNAKKFDIDFDFENKSIHIHVPAGAIPKDGPSAGVTFTTAIISALSKKEVPANIGMTGEITLRGKVLPIGGLKEKSLAASQFGIKKVFIPYDNAKNLIDVPDEVKNKIEFVPVKYYDEIYEQIFKNNFLKAKVIKL